MPRISEISLKSLELSPEELQKLLHFEYLTKLHLTGDYDDRSLAIISKITTIKKLTLWIPVLSGNGCRLLTNLNRLKYLDISHSKINEDGMPPPFLLWRKIPALKVGFFQVAPKPLLLVFSSRKTRGQNIPNLFRKRGLILRQRLCQCIYVHVIGGERCGGGDCFSARAARDDLEVGGAWTKSRARNHHRCQGERMKNNDYCCHIKQHDFHTAETATGDGGSFSLGKL